MKKQLLISSLIFTSIMLNSSKITIYNNTFKPITATVNYNSDKTKQINVAAASHESWDNIFYNMRSVKINRKSLLLENGISKRFDVFYNGTKIDHGQGIRPDKQFINPNPKLKYNEVCFLGAHNAHAAHAYGYLYAQQDKKIEDQLESGVRVLLLDTYPANKDDLTVDARPKPGESIEDYEAMLWHGPLGKNLKMTLKDTLITIKSFLQKHPDQIVTIQLENYTPNKIIDSVIERSNISNFILKPSDWNPKDKDGWPTLNWMIKENKRLVIFNSKGSSKYSYHQWIHTSENQYGELDIKKAAQLRKEGARGVHYLWTINYFGTVTTPVVYPATNSTKLRKLVDYILKNGRSGKYKNRYPNVIALDYITRGKNGDPLKLINEINNKSETTKNRATKIFRPLNPRE